MSVLCACGCGQPTKLASYTSLPRGWVRGQPIRFLHGHNGTGTKRTRVDVGPKNASWKGGRRINALGYMTIRVTSGKCGTYRHEHDLIAERVLGRRLPLGVVVHHVDGTRKNNSNDNLVILQSPADHNELHRKMRVRAVGGDPWRDRLCSTCRKAKPASEFYRGFAIEKRCKDCSKAYARTHRRAA